jgi:hypothetical protein
MRNIPFTRSSKLSEDLDTEGLGTSEMPEKGVDDKALLGKDNVRITNRIDNYGNQILEDLSGKSAGFGQFEVEVLEGVLKKGEMAGKKLSSAQTKSIEDILSSQPAQRLPGAPAGIGGTRMEEFTGATTYTEAEIARATNIYTEEIGTIDKYLETPNLPDDVRKTLANEAAELDIQLEYEKAKMGTSLEELQTAKSIEAANLKAGIEMSAEDIKSASVNVTAKASESAEAAVGTPKDINKGTGRSTSGLFGETKGILGDAGDVPKLDVKAKFPTTDQGALEISKAQTKLDSLNKKLKGDIDLQTNLSKNIHGGISMPDLAAEIASTKKDIKNTKSYISRRTNPTEALYASELTMTGVYNYTPGEPSPDAKIQNFKGQTTASSISSAESATASGDFSYQVSEAGRAEAIKKAEALDVKYDKPSYYLQGPGASGGTLSSERIKAVTSFDLGGGVAGTINETGTAVSTPPKPAQEAINIGKIETTPKYSEIFDKAIKDFGGDVAKATVIATRVAKNFYKRSPMIMTGLEVIPKAFNKFIDKDYSA